VIQDKTPVKTGEKSGNPGGRVMRYITVESTAYCVASCRQAHFRLTYEVKPLREGLESWFLLSMEEIQNEPPSNLT
jgi:hypothetical protein